MQRYQCHKIVEAAKIISVGVGGVRVAGVGDGPDEVIQVGDTWMARYQPESPDDLGYFVRYADGYKSWSPTKAFEAGYTVLADGAEVADRNWRDWVSFVFTDNTDRFQRMTDGELRTYVCERWDPVQKGDLIDGQV